MVLAAVALFYLIPIELVGDPAYPATQYRATLVAVAVDAIIGLTTQRLVSRVRHQARQARLRERMLQQVSETVHSLSDSSQPRHEVCEATRAASSACGVLLFESAREGSELSCTAAAGAVLPTERLACTALRPVGAIGSSWQTAPAHIRT